MLGRWYSQVRVMAAIDGKEERYMSRKKSGIFAALIPLVLVVCVSLAIVGGVVAWMSAREGTGLGKLVADLLSGRQSARPVLAYATPFPTHIPRPLPTLMPEIADATEEAGAEPAPALLPTDTPPANAPSPTDPISASPTPMPESPVEQAIASPIHPGSPLPEHPATRLIIPAMELDVPVVVSPIVSQTWKVDHLGKDFVGHLEGTASPGDPSNVVMAGHVTIAHNVYGPFAGLGRLEKGDPVIVYAEDQSYTYIVDYRKLVDRADVHIAYPTDVGRVTLITCSNWSDNLGAYQERLIVVGHLAGAGS
jgi:sortase A